MAQYYEHFKALHIIFVVSWFAGLFYIVRLFIYHTEAKGKSPEEFQILGDQFKIMEKKLWWIITTPAMILTVIFGILMFSINPGLLLQTWMQIKIVFVTLLLFYHFFCQHILANYKKDTINWTSFKLRLWNELATIFLVAIVFIVTLKSTFNWISGFISFFLVAIVLMIFVKVYKKISAKSKVNE
jgi:protoporphyrinogen IX oxidase